MAEQPVKTSTGFELFVPESHLACTLSSFDWEKKEQLKDLLQGIVDGTRKKGLLLIGDPGVGKTHLMVATFKAMLDQGAVLGQDVLFLQWSQFIQEMHVALQMSLIPEHILARLVAKVLFVDDIHQVGGRVWNDLLKKLIEQVYDSERLAVLSTNANTPEELVRVWNLEDYWYSRLVARFDIVHVKGKDRRLG